MTTKAAAAKATKAAKPAAKAVTTKAVAVPKARAIFGPDQCHQRDAKGAPSCDQTRQKGRNLCPTHEKAWQVEARKRRAARVASGTPAPNAPKGVNSAGTSKATVATKRATRSQTKGRATQPKRDPIAHGAQAAKPHPMTVLRQPVQRQPSPVAQKVATAR